MFLRVKKILQGFLKILFGRFLWSTTLINLSAKNYSKALMVTGFGCWKFFLLSLSSTTTKWYIRIFLELLLKCYLYYCISKLYGTETTLNTLIEFYHRLHGSGKMIQIRYQRDQGLKLLLYHFLAVWHQLP